MRLGLPLFLLILVLGFYTGLRLVPHVPTAALSNSQIEEAWAAQAAPSSTSAANTFATEVPAKVDFATNVRPILDPKCQPCHFNGGTMYQRLPFDRPETIKTLGTKLFTRIKDENERQIIRAFLTQE